MINKTYKQLYWDEDFIKKRVKEQKEYIYQLQIRIITPLRFTTLYTSACHILLRLERQLKNIQKLE